MKKRTSPLRLLLHVLLPVYVGIILYITFFSRGYISSGWELQPFWSYAKWFAGDKSLGREILLNVALFVPVGALRNLEFRIQNSELWDPAKPDEFQKISRQKLRSTILFGFVLSVVIELAQLVFSRGMCEFDDVFNNTLGTAVGAVIATAVGRKFKIENLKSKIMVDNAAGRGKKANAPLPFCLHATACAIITIALLSLLPETESNVNLPIEFAFQVESAKAEPTTTELTGFSFFYNRPAKMPSVIILKSNDGEPIRMRVQTGLPSPAAKYYNNGNKDYSCRGFAAKAESPLQTGINYEIVVRFDCLNQFSSGTFLFYDGSCLYVSRCPHEQEITAAAEICGTDLAFLAEEGTLLVNRPDAGCRVYQYDSCLYWLADEYFRFEKGGTYIQYQLWTTQKDRLPQSRLENEWYWDNLGGGFEAYEITEQLNCGRFRVMKRELPQEYAVTSVATGFVDQDDWIWLEYFRPENQTGQ